MIAAWLFAGSLLFGAGAFEFPLAQAREQVDSMKSHRKERLRSAHDELEAGPVAWSTASPGNPWSGARSPSKGPAQSIGGYSAGCVRGAVELEPSSNYQIMRPSRFRYFGHPDLIRVVRGVGAGARSFGVLLVGDLAQPRGGPTMSSHVSHQTGLDVDLWFLLPPPGTTLSVEQREKLSAANMVLPEFGGLNPKTWNPRVLDVLKLAAQASETERVLVNPVIKREACRLHQGQDWLAKLRPWWGHDDHLHMRLRCPAADAHCKGQEPPPASDGCGAELEEWFTEERRREGRERAGTPTPPRMPKLPELCAAVIAE